MTLPSSAQSPASPVARASQSPSRPAPLDTVPDESADKFTMYVLVRTDIDPVQQVVQASHAAAEAGRTFYAAHHGIASLIVLGVPDREALLAAQRRLCAQGLGCELFFEPDFGIGESALATEPLNAQGRRRLRGWPLLRLPACED